MIILLNIIKRGNMRQLKAWLVALGKVLVKPTRKTFEELAADSKDKLAGSIICVFMGILIGEILSSIKEAVSPGDLLRSYVINFAVILFPIAFLVFVFVVYSLLRKMKALSQSDYAAILYIFSLLFFDYFVISGLAVFIPYINLYVQIALLIGLHIIIYVALHAINRVRWWQTVIALFIGYIGFLLTLTLGATLFNRLVDIEDVINNKFH